jgi:LysM repeat protein
MFGKDSRTSMDRGSGMLQSIVGGGGFSDLVGRIGGSSGLSRSAVTSLLGLLAPLVLGLLKKEKIARNLDAIGIASLLASQRNNIRAAMPDNMLHRAETPRDVAGEPYRASRTTRTETIDRAEPARHSYSWLLPLALVAGLIGLMWSLASRPPRTTVQAGRETVRVVPQVTTPSSLERLKVKYQSVINEAHAQGIKMSNLYEENGKLVMKGVAPSSAAVANVWNEIRRVNPRQDDITVDFTVAETSALPAVPQSNRTYRDSSDQTYTVKAGDTLGSISDKFYGSSGEYMRIFNANRDQLTNHNRITVGQELKIPR